MGPKLKFMKKIFLFSTLLIGIAFLSACSARPPEGNGNLRRQIHGHADTLKGEIAPAALQEKIQKGERIVLLDVREENEYAEVHIPGTTHRISAEDISQETLTQAGINKTDEIIVYCRSGNRSRTAAQKMRELGYSNVWELNSGIVHWIEDGFPTETGSEIGTSTAPVLANGPRIAFDRENHDFGEIPQFGGKVSTQFTLKNEGNSPLILGTLTTSCSCTEARVENMTIAPGSETTLSVTFNPNLHEEPLEKFKRTIFIPSNDPQEPEAEVTIEVDILEGR